MTSTAYFPQVTIIPDGVPEWTVIKSTEYFNKLKVMPQSEKPVNYRFYRKKDYSDVAVEKLYQQFKDGLIENYLVEKEGQLTKVPVVINPGLK